MKASSREQITNLMVFLAGMQFVVFMLIVLFFKERPESESGNEEGEEESALVDNQGSNELESNGSMKDQLS